MSPCQKRPHGARPLILHHSYPGNPKRIAGMIRKETGGGIARAGASAPRGGDAGKTAG